MCSNCMSMSCKYRYMKEQLKFIMGMTPEKFNGPFITVWHQGRMNYVVGCFNRKPDGAE